MFKGVVPIPDPTTLTTVQLNREIAWLKSNIDTKIKCLEDGISSNTTRAEQLAREVDSRILHVKEVHDGIFRLVQVQFEDRDKRYVESSSENRERVKSALESAREMVAIQNQSAAMAVGKSEAAVTKQIDALSTLIQSSNAGINEKIDTNNKAMNDKIEDTKSTVVRMGDRLTLIEGKGYGKETAQAGQQNSSSLMVAIVVAAISFVGLMLMIVNQARVGQ